ncbi:Peptidyl-prolyl cis-trans isomerase CWC27 like protein [Eufriesea mexicana]|nr:Peptidyl-prolyl cis-trans isomerase CWC27 like protein [Eufriesea mexicana]
MPRKSFSRLVSDTHFCHCQSRHASRSLVALRLVRHLVQHEGPSTLVVLGANSCTRPGDGPCSRNHCKSVPACPDALGGYVVMFAQSLGMEHARDSDCHRLIDSILCVGINIECMGTLSSFLENENSETIKATGIMGLWHMEVIWPIKLTSEEGKRYREGGKIHVEPFKDKFHTRLRFSRRDLIVMANAGKDDNGSQFFFTFSSTPDLQNKHTIFGKVTGETIYNMLKLEEALVDENDRPLYPPKLLRTIILNNSFSNIIPRIIVQEKFGPDSIILYNEKFCYRDFNLLSFSEEAEKDEEESVILSGKGISAHDHLTDPKLSSQSAVESLGFANKKRKEDHSSDWENDDEVEQKKK